MSYDDAPRRAVWFNRMQFHHTILHLKPLSSMPSQILIFWHFCICNSIGMLPPTFWINIDPSQRCGKMKTFAIWNICFLVLNDQKKRINQLFWAIFQLIFSQSLKKRHRVLVWVWRDHPLHPWPQSTQKQPQNEPRYPPKETRFPVSPLYLIQEGRKVGRQPNICIWNFFSC